MIADPDNFQLMELASASGLASVASWQYDKTRQSTWSYICGSYSSADIYDKIIDVTSNPENEHTKNIVIGLLVAFSYRKLSEAQPFLDLLITTDDRWIDSIKKSVIAQAAKN